MPPPSGWGCGSAIFVLFYLLVAAGSVTHKDLFLETPVRLPFLGVDLPLKGFFVLGPLLFLIVHAYVLLHFAMLSGKVRAFDTELRGQIDDGDIRTRLRRQLPSSIFVQFLAGPSEVRDGPMGGLLWLIAMVSLMIGPILLLIFFALQFLPYHNEAVTWWQRGAVGVDLWLIWVFWPRIVLLDGAAEDLGGATQRMIVLQRRLGRGAMWGLTGGSTLLLLLFATFPGETIDEALWQPKGFLPRDSAVKNGVKPPAWQREWTLKAAGLWVAHIPGAVRGFLVEGEVQPASRTPESLWSNRLVLPGLDVVVHLKLDSEDKIKFLPETVSLRDRDLKQAVLIGAVLRKADFTGARMGGALLDEANLRDAKMGCAYWLAGATTSDGERRQPICTNLQGASLNFAQLQGASLFGAQLQGASLDRAQLQGASLDSAQLQGASLQSVFIWRADAVTANATNAWMEPVRTYRSAPCNNPATNDICDWTKANFDDLIARIEQSVPEGRARDEALQRLDPRLNPDTDKPPANEAAIQAWWNKPDTPRAALPAYEAERAKHWQAAGCSAAGAPHVVARLTRGLDPAISENARWFFGLPDPFSDNSPEPAKLAAAFLDERCEGARGLSDSAKAILVKLRGPVAATPLSPPTTVEPK